MANLFVVLHWNWFYFSFNLPRMLSALLRSVHSFFSSLFFFLYVCVLSLSLFLSLTPLFICFESVQQTRTQRNCINYKRWHRNVHVFNVTIFILLYMISHLAGKCTVMMLSAFSFNNREIFSSVFANFALDGNDSSILWSFIADGNIKIQCMSCHFLYSFLRIDIWHVSPKSLIITKKSIESTSSEIFDVIIWKMF